ncbi:hypothetical protein GCM10017635_05590 [Paracoccus kondratievae]|uniref:Transposase n=1 Tax=Paracoccus kondratievae TaxID=135740 RepID=A0AAD3RST8_9RHOB|nr:hypothetical protein GCM10017635_05590 [Paracoccus kondratievae]
MSSSSGIWAIRRESSASRTARRIPGGICSGAGANIAIRSFAYAQLLVRRWTIGGLREDILDALNHAKLAPDKLQMVDSTVIRAHHHAAGAKGGLRKRLLAVREVGSRPGSISASTAQASR